MSKIAFNLKYIATMHTFMLIVALIPMMVVLLFMLNLAKKNFKDFRNNDSSIGYLYTYSPSKSKLHLISKSIFCSIMFVLYFSILIFYIKDVMIPAIKDAPKLITNDYEYTTGIVYEVRNGRSSNIIFVNGLKIYETKVFIKGKIKQGHEYKIAYLRNTKECVGFEEL